MAVSITSNHNRNIGGRQAGNLAHNRREFTPHNVDPALTGNNIVFKNSNLVEIYEEAFGDAIDNYNRKQRRSDRRKYDRKSYFKHLFGVDPDSENASVILTSNARGKHEIKSFNEELFQVDSCMLFGNFKRDKQGNFIDKNGNPVKWNKKKQMYYDINGNAVTDSCNLIPNPNAELAKRILCDFYEGGRFKFIRDVNGKPSLKRLEDNDMEKPDLVIPSFEERNPNFHIVYAAMHNDEWHGTPHIHINYVPVGEGYTKGPEKQVGFERALKNMGFEDKNTAYKEWREKERQILKEICGYYGLEIKTKEEERENNRNKTYSTNEYKEIIRTACADAQSESERIMERARKSEKAIIDKAAESASVIRDRAEIDAKALREEADEYAQSVRDKALEEAAQIINAAKQEAEELRAENQRLSKENEKIKNDTEQERKQLDILADRAVKSIKRKPFSRETFTMNKEQHDEILEAAGYIKRSSHNTLTSDEDRQAVADERKRQELITANLQQEIAQKAAQQVAEHKKATEDGLKKFKSDWIKENKKYIKIMQSCIEFFSGKSYNKAINEFREITMDKRIKAAALNIGTEKNEEDYTINPEL